MAKRTNSNTSVKGSIQNSAAQQYDFAQHAERYAAVGKTAAIAAASATNEAGTQWSSVRDAFIEGQTNGKGREAHDCIFAAGDAVKGKKAPWYRTYKSLLNAAVEHGINVTAGMGATALQKAIKAAKEEKAENDPEAAASKAEQLLSMFGKMAQGCLNAGIPKAKLAAILKGLE